MRVLMLLSSLILIVSCGSAIKEKNLKDAKTISILGKTLYLKSDDLYEATCNPFFFDFVATSTSNGCVALTTKPSIGETWVMKSADGKIDITATEVKDQEKLKIGSTEYYCYFYSGSVFTKDGEEKYSGSHVLLVSSPAEKPTTVKGADVFLLATSSQEVCSAMF